MAVLKTNRRMEDVSSAHGALGTSSGNEIVIQTFTHTDTNGGSTIGRLYRFGAGSSHETSAYELRRKTDSTDQAFWRLRSAGFAWGYGTTVHWGGTSDGHLLPEVTESYNIGSSSFEVDNAFLENAVTVSDARTKIDLGLIDGAQAVDFVCRLEPRWFRKKNTELTDGTVIRHSRPHAGFFAQQVKEAMTAAGIADFAGYAYEPDTDTHLLRLMEMVGILTAAVKHLAAGGAVAAKLEPEPEPPPPDPVIIEREKIVPDPADKARIQELTERLERVEAAMQPALDKLQNGPDTPRDIPQDYGAGEGGGTPEIITKEEVDRLLGMGADEASEAVQAMKADRRRRFTELLYAEHAELVNKRGMAGENLTREADIEGLLGLFARLGVAPLEES